MVILLLDLPRSTRCALLAADITTRVGNCQRHSSKVHSKADIKTVGSFCLEFSVRILDRGRCGRGRREAGQMTRHPGEVKADIILRLCPEKGRTCVRFFQFNQCVLSRVEMGENSRVAFPAKLPPSAAHNYLRTHRGCRVPPNAQCRARGRRAPGWCRTRRAGRRPGDEIGVRTKRSTTYKIYPYIMTRL